MSGVRCREALNLIPDTRHLTPILVRLDLFLKASRLCARRTVAQNICEAGRISVNGKTAKPSHAVKAGDEITITRRDKITTVRVLSLPTTRQTSRKEAMTLYEILSEETVDDLN
jgi:ribosomal 50S subunit-recycling heat shock protein